MRNIRYACAAWAIFVSGGAWARNDIPALPPLPTFPALSASGATAPIPVVSAPSVPLAPLPHVKGGAFDLRYVNVGQLVDLLYGDALHVPHVISSDVLQDTRLVSFQYDGKQGDLRTFVGVFLDSLGFAVETRDGVDFVSRKAVDEQKRADQETFVYRPRFRTAAYLSKLVQPFFSGRMNTVSQAAVVPMASASMSSAAVPLGASSPLAAALPESSVQGGVSSADELVMIGSASEIRSLKQLLPQIDFAAGEVVVRGWVYEVSDTDSSNSAFSIAAKVLGGSLSVSNGDTASDATALRFSGGMLNVAISALNADSRFRQISDPHVRVVSGESVSLNVGSQVPTLGSISYQGASGTPVQSVEYQDAGLIFNVQPTVMAEAIEVRLQEQLSSFAATTTGVNNSPTKNTRQMNTTVNMKDGEVIVLGGLDQNADSTAVNSPVWLPKFLDGHSGSKARTEILLVLQVQKI